VVNLLAFKCTKNVLEKAKELRTMFEDKTLKELVEFVGGCHISLRIDEIATKYIEELGKKGGKNDKEELFLVS
jgi:predicted xylose isomerase-like sugar epimerase